MGTRFVRQCAVGCWAGVDVLVAVADLFGTEELLVAGTLEAPWPWTFWFSAIRSANWSIGPFRRRDGRFFVASEIDSPSSFIAYRILA
jgi:hypothetical protein